MKKRAVIFHPAIAPYRIDFFNSLSETFDASFYFEFEDPLEQSFDKEKMRRRLAFMPMFLRPGFCGVKNLRLDVWKVLSISSFDVVLISEYNLLGLLVLLHKWLFRKRVKIYTICDDNVDMAKSVGIIKKFTRFILLNFIDGTILADKKAFDWYREHLFYKARYFYFPIIQSEENFRKNLERALPRSRQILKESFLQDKKAILFVGRLVKVKNISLLLDCYAQICLKMKNVVLIVVGEGDLEDELRRQADELHISDSVFFVGKKEGEELMAFYNLGAIFVLPSTYEPFGAVVNEALLAGCYTLCSSCAGASCLIQEDENGNCFSVNNPEDLITRLQYALSIVEPLTEELTLKENRMVLSYEEQYSRFVYEFLEDK